VRRVCKRRVRRARVQVGVPDESLTRFSWLAAVTELVERLGVIERLDAAVGPIKTRDRGLSAGQMLVHRGQVIGRCEDTTGIEPFSRLVTQVMIARPYARADRVFWIVDNGSSHRGQASIDRMRHAWPNAHLIHLPVHASWLDQAEIYFSVVQRKVVAPNDFTDLEQIRERLAAFEARYNAVARPFNWKFTRRELENPLHRIDTHDNPTHPQRQAA
jgi:hypothetical protein